LCRFWGFRTEVQRCRKLFNHFFSFANKTSEDADILAVCFIFNHLTLRVKK
jgi:hypothetical protein